MQVQINILELASELASNKLIKFQEDALNGFIEKLPLPNGIVKENENGDTIYTEEAQDKFNKYYDEFYSIIEKHSLNVDIFSKLEYLKSSHIAMVNSLDYQEFDDTKYEDNLDYIMDQNFENEDFNVGYEQARQATYNEVIRELKNNKNSELENAMNNVTSELFKNLERGSQISLTKNYVLYRYTEEDIYVIIKESEWLEVLQVMTNKNKFLFEQL